jgi:hypothetical protein
MRVKCGVSAGPRKKYPIEPKRDPVGNPEEHKGATASALWSPREKTWHIRKITGTPKSTSGSR